MPKQKRVLIVVDVQKGFSPYFTKDYLMKVQAFVETGNWDKVVVRFVGDTEYVVSDEERNYLFTIDDSNVLPPFLLQDSFAYSDREFGYELAEDAEVVIPDKLWRTQEQGQNWLFTESPNGDMYCPTKEIENLVYEQSEIHIIGGFQDLCVKEVQEFLLIAGDNPVMLHEELCFNGKAPLSEEAVTELTKGWMAKEPA